MKNNYLLLVLVSCLLISCTNKNKEAAIQTVQSFFDGIKNDKTEKHLELYPDFKNVGSFYKSDSIKVKDIKSLNDNKYEIIIENHFTNGYGKKFNQDISLFLDKKIDSKEIEYYIYDSKGICDFADKDEYTFAQKTGCLNKEDITDQQISKKLDAATDMMKKYFLEMYLKLRQEVQITSWEWESGYGDSASGKGIVKNNSDYDIPKLQYKITYKDRNGNEITTDDGYVTYDKLQSGSSKAFTFYTSYVGDNAQKASIELDFDTDLIIKYISDAEYSGNEYNDFINSSSVE